MGLPPTLNSRRIAGDCGSKALSNARPWPNKALLTRRTFLWGSAALVASCRGQAAEEITVVSYGGGAYQQSHQKAFLDPFSVATHVKTQSATWGAEYGKLKAMVLSGRVDWDVVDVTAAILNRGKRDGIFEPIGVHVDPASFISGTIDSFGIGNVYWGTALATRRADYPNGATWADFFDVARHPGPRAIYDDPRGNIEFALLAAGVPKSDLYPLSPDKIRLAFEMLDRIRSSIRVYWTDGSQPVQLLLTSQVSMTPAWTGRIFASPEASRDLAYSWDGAALELDYWAIPKGSKHTVAARKFIDFASGPEVMGAQARLIGYGPANKAALGHVDHELLVKLPTYGPNFQSAFVVNAEEWEKAEDELHSRWLRWKAGRAV